MKHLCLAVLMTLSFSAIAGDKGNGGDGVVCGENVKILDEYEFEGMGLNYISDASDSYRSQVNAAISNLSKALPAMASDIKVFTDELLADVDAFKQDTRNIDSYAYKVALFTKADLVEIDDSNHELVPAGCKIQQLARFNDQPVGFSKKYTFDLKLFKRLSNRSIASIILHESVFRYLRLKYNNNSISGSYTSKNARHFHNLITSVEMSTLSVTEFMHYLSELRVNRVMVDGVLVYFVNLGFSRSVNMFYELESDKKEFVINGLGTIVLDGQEFCYDETNTTSYPNSNGSYSTSQWTSTNCRLIQSDFERTVTIAGDFPVSIESVKLLRKDKIIK